MKKFLALMLGLVLVMTAFVSCSETEQTVDTDNNSAPSGGTNSGNTPDTTDSYDLEGTWQATMTLYDLNPGLTNIVVTTTGSDDTDADATESETTDSGTTDASVELVEKLATETTITYTLTFTGDKYTLKANEAEFEKAVDAFADICVERFKISNPDVEIDQFFADNDLTEEQFRSNIKAAMGSSSETGTWSLSDGKLTLNDVAFTFEADDESNFTIYNGDIYYLYSKA